MITSHIQEQLRISTQLKWLRFTILSDWEAGIGKISLNQNTHTLPLEIRCYFKDFSCIYHTQPSWNTWLSVKFATATHFTVHFVRTAEAARCQSKRDMKQEQQASPPSAFHWDTKLFCPHLGTEYMLYTCISQKIPKHQKNTTIRKEGKKPHRKPNSQTPTTSTPKECQFWIPKDTLVVSAKPWCFSFP